jgi:hypothetical protein
MRDDKPTTHTAEEILTAARNMDRAPAQAAWRAGNDAGDGFDGDAADNQNWDLILGFESDDQVNVFADCDDVVLVNADGWAVRVEG